MTSAHPQRRFNEVSASRERECSRWKPLRPITDHPLTRSLNILADEMPMIFTYDPVYVGLKQKWPLNYKPSSLSSELIYVDVDLALKARKR